MSLVRASCQPHRTLRDHYEKLQAGSHAELAEAGRKMIQLVERLEESLRDIPVWGLTSHYHLLLLAADDYRSAWFVSIAPPASGKFVIEYAQANAPVLGEAESVSSAVDMVLQAMEKSGGWKMK